MSNVCGSAARYTAKIPINMNTEPPSVYKKYVIVARSL